MRQGLTHKNRVLTLIRQALADKNQALTHSLTKVGVCLGAKVS